MSEKTKVVIAGAGYAGISAALALAKRKHFMNVAEVTIIDKNDRHIILTELHRVASGELSSGRVSVSINEILEGTGINFLNAEVSGTDPVGRTVYSSGRDLHFDYLILCTGSADNRSVVPGAEKFALGLKTLKDALEIRSRFKTMLESGKKQKTEPVVIVGGGATGVELAASMSDNANSQSSKVPIVLVEAAPHILPGRNYSPRMIKKTEAHLCNMGIELKTKTKILNFSKGKIKLDNGEEIKTGLVVWTGGQRGNCVISGNVETTKDNRIKARPELNLHDYPQIFVVGDCALVQLGQTPLPSSGQFAIQQGETAADNIVSLSRGKAPVRYAPDQKGEFISIGQGVSLGWMSLVEIWGHDAQFIKDSIRYRYLLKVGPAALKTYLNI